LLSVIIADFVGSRVGELWFEIAELDTMPIYEYQCQACQQHLETLQKISAEPLRVCPACHEPALKKLVSASAFRLKGGGWYETDFKTGNKKNLSSDSGGDSVGGSSGDKSAGGSAKVTDKKDATSGASQKKTSSSPAVKASNSS
jgi:putative FmdB family regulatory protein